MKENNHVKTAIRWRQACEHREVAIEKVKNNIVGIIRNNQTFMFDNVFDSSEQCEVYEVLVKPLIDKAIEGFDCTFLASGQTGSGKTYTMGFERSVNPENNGMATRVLSSLFTHENFGKFKMLISFIEIYNDQAFDLLSANPQEAFYTKDPGHRSTVATKKSVKSENEVQALLSMGTKKRRIRRTNMNSISSRSHAIFTIYLGMEHQENEIRESVINLVDLAGSESFKKTGNTAEASAEGKSINEGLSAFKRVISAIALGSKHIPYRDAMITTILKNSLNTRAYLTLLGCVSPYEDDYGETLSTLRFVAEAKLMKMTPTLNAIIDEYKKSKTPVKKLETSRLLQTPKSVQRFMTPFKRPLSLIQNKLSFSAKRMSEPRNKGLTHANSSSIKKFNRISALNSSEKKPNRFVQTKRSLRKSFSGQGNKSKTVTNLFPINDTTFQNNDTIQVNWANASTSSVIEIDASIDKPQNRENQPPIQQSTYHMEKYLRQCFAEDEELTILNSPIREQVIKSLKKKLTEINPNPKPTIVETKNIKCELKSEQKSVQVTQPEVIQTIVPETVEPPAPSLQSIQENESEIIQTPAPPIFTQVTDLIANEWNDLTLPEVSNVTNVLRSIENEAMDVQELPMNVDHIDKGILLTTTTNHVPFMQSPPQINNERMPQLEMIIENSSLENPVEESLQDSIENTLISFATNDSLINEKVSFAKPIARQLSKENSKIFDNTAPFVGIPSKESAFVSPLIFRKLEKDERLSTSSIYEIVKKDQNAEQFETVEPSSMYSDSDPDFSYATQSTIGFSYAELEPQPEPEQKPEEKILIKTTEKAPVTLTYEVASKAPTTYMRFPMSPRLILHRIDSITEYQQSLKRKSIYLEKKVTQRPKRAKITRTESIRKPSKTKAKTIKSKSKTPVKQHLSHYENILRSLNEDNEKELQKLPQIGQKRAIQIYTYRAINGKFESIEAMKKMQFWNEKIHQKFLVYNNLK